MEKNIVIVVLVALLLLQCYGIDSARIQQPSPQKSQRGAQTRQSFGCSKNEFTCGNKQCIPALAVCDGQNNCQDGTDEDNERCTVIQTGMCTGRKHSKKFCDDLPDGTVSADDNLNSTYQFFCRSDVLKEAKSLSLTCVNRIWTPTTTLCSRVCKALTLPTSNITCLRNGVKVDCNKPLLVGTKIKLQCEFYYEPNVKEIVCQENGEWDEKAVHCIPKCGRQFKGRIGYTTEIRPVESREFPWNAAIYYTKPGTKAAIWIPGTIISPYLVVTTAINFYADFQQEIATVESLSVVVAKVTKSAKVKDDQFQRSYRVKNIYFTETGLQNSSQDSLSSENIALIELHEKLVLSPSVYPACVNWEKNDTLFPQDGELGQVLHTLNIHQANAQATTQSEILQTLALRFVSRKQCLRKDFIKSVVRTDNFCGEQIPAPAPCDGGYVFLEMNTNLFFLLGLVDGVTPTSLDTIPPLFTNTFIDLSVHIDWINAVRKSNEDRMVNKYLRLEVVAANSLDICAKNNDEEGESAIDVRFSIGRERRRKSEEDAEGKVKSLECLLPTKWSMNAYNYSISCPMNDESNSCRKIKENSMVPEYTLVKLACVEGFMADIKRDQEAVCFKGQWNPALAPCSKYCGKLPTFDNATDFACYEEDRLVKCTDYLKIGSKVVAQCKRAYKTERSTESHEFNCQDDGKWSGTLLECVKKPARGAVQSKSNTPVTQTRNQNGSSRNEGQPSLQPRSVVRNSKNQTLSNPNRGFIQTNPGRTPPINSTENQSEHTAAESRPKPNLTKNRRPQVEVQTKNGLVPQDEYVENEWNPDLQNLNSDVHDDNVDKKKTCSKNEFSCDKHCIPLSAVCNGTIECKDGQDESPESCKILSTDSCTPNSDSPKYCEIETLSNTDLNRNQPPKEKHAFLCSSKYMEKDSEGIPLNCVNGVSTPSTIPCTRICKNITVIAAGLDCYRNGVPVDCKKPLLSGTEIKPRCEPEYKPNFNGSTCNDKGEWEHSVVECIPECGKSTRKAANMTKTIRPAQFREFPWNVAVYKKSKDTNSSVLFGGIIISPTLVLTNAHCCAAEVMANDEGNMDVFEVTVAKRRSSTSYIEEDEFQKTIQVKAVHLMDNFKPNSERLALVELAEKITSCPAVQPVCVNWRNNVNIMANDGTLGLVAHWRTRDRTNSDTVHEMLQAVAMTLHTTESCQKRVHKDFLKYLTKDAFCVEPISTMTPAHRGAGFVYADRATKLNYVQGVIYFTGTQEGEPASFTNMFLNISTHIDWINNVRRKTEKRTHHEWVLNTRLAASNDVCNSLNGTDGNNDENIDSQNVLDTRSDFSIDGKSDDFMENGCVLPDKTWLYLDYNVSCLPSRREKECKKADAGGVVPEFASLTLSCNDGYTMNNSEEVVCFRKNWSPPVEPCRRICDKLELENVTLKCFWEDKRVECDSELKFGATAIAECAPYYYSEKSLPKLFCDEYGHWKDSSEVKCSRFDPWEEKDEYFKYSTQI